jgi:nitroreductase
VGAYLIVELSTNALLTTTRSVRKRLDLTKPLPIVPCVEVSDSDGTLTGENANQYWSSIMPAAWSYMLAARSRGLGTTRTGVTIMADDEMRAILGLPDNVYHATTIPTAYYTGTTFRRAKRIPLDDVVHFDRW